MATYRNVPFDKESTVFGQKVTRIDVIDSVAHVFIAAFASPVVEIGLSNYAERDTVGKFDISTDPSVNLNLGQE